MTETEKTTDDLLEIIKTLPENKCKQLYDFALFLTWQTKKTTDNNFFLYFNKRVTESNKEKFITGLTVKDIKECFGLWKGRSISKESIRKKAWRNEK
ncbi:MAG: hypothetical protein K8R54_18915 [Bacteroidales bacterium]|nr:hypothetical protein [Bacteroidales bacterium]